MNTDQQYPYMTWQQLKLQYPDSWILLLDPKRKSNSQTLLGGQFVASEQSQDDALGQAQLVPPGHRMSVIFTGTLQLPDNLLLCL